MWKRYGLFRDIEKTTHDEKNNLAAEGEVVSRHRKGYTRQQKV